MRLPKVWTILTFELRSAISRPAYLLMTFGMPLFFVLVGGLPAWLQREAISAELDRTSVYAAVDQSGLLYLGERERDIDSLDAAARDALRRVPDRLRVVIHASVVLLPTDSEAEARRMLMRGWVDGVIVVPEDVVGGGVIRMIVPARPSPLDVSAATTRRHVRALLIQGLLHGQVPVEISDRVRDPLENLQHFEMDEGGRLREVEDVGLSALARFLVPLSLSMLLLMALMTTGGYLVQAIGEEKENRVIEVLLATVRPQELLAGKLLGLGAAGMLQFSIWAAGFGVTLVSLLGVLEDVAVPVPWGAIAVAPVLFVIGYLFYGSLMLGTGSLGRSASESQKLTMMWGMLALVPMLFFPMFLDNPHGLGPLIMHWVPFTAPLAIVLRMAQDPAGVAAWEIGGSICVLIVCTWLSVRIGARLFRVGVMLSGGWPGWRQVLRQAEIVD